MQPTFVRVLTPGKAKSLGKWHMLAVVYATAGRVHYWFGGNLGLEWEKRRLQLVVGMRGFTPSMMDAVSPASSLAALRPYSPPHDLTWKVSLSR